VQLQNYKTIIESELQGNLMLAWGPPGVGKSATILQTAEDPIVYITAEKRKIGTTVAAINRQDMKMKVGVYETFDDCIETFNNYDLFSGCKTTVLDSLTHLMVSQLSYEILQENFDSHSEKEKQEIIKQLTVQVKMSKEGFGALADNMVRLMNALQNLTMRGIDVICTARSEERPKYNRELGIGPALAGQKFGNVMPGYFDFIAYLEAPEHADEPIPAPDSPMEVLWKYHAPLASFDNNDGYLAKWTGVYPAKGIVRRKFNVRRVFAEANGLV
jgi:hypothetical protein